MLMIDIEIFLTEKVQNREINRNKCGVERASGQNLDAGDFVARGLPSRTNMNLCNKLKGFFFCSTNKFV